MRNLTVLILTLNEELHIKRCIDSLLPLTNNIFIIDSYSTDRTVEIAKSLGAQVYQNRWPGNHSLQLQWGLEHCPIKTEWIMKMDADEYILPELAQEIKTNIDTLEDDVSGIYIKRRVYFMNRWIKHGGYYPTWLLRIWRHKQGQVEQRWMDEHIKLHSGKSIYFEHDLVDDNKNDLTWWTQKHNHYATREAADILNMIYNFKQFDSVEAKFSGTQEQRKRWLKKRYAALPLFLRPLLYFIWRYLFQFGFLDAKAGLIWHFLQGGWYRFLVDAKIHEIYVKAGKEKKDIQKFLQSQYNIKF